MCLPPKQLQPINSIFHVQPRLVFPAQAPGFAFPTGLLVLLVQVPLLFSSISLQNPVKQQQARRDAMKYKAPAASPTFQPRSASRRDFVPSGGQFVQRNRGNQEGILKEVRQKTGVSDSKSTTGATNSSASRAGNEGGLAVGTKKKGAK